MKDYGKVIGFLEELPGNQTIWADGGSVCLSHWKKLAERNRVLEKRNPTERLKAVKNPTELAKMEEYFLLDSVAVTKFIYWLKTNRGSLPAEQNPYRNAGNHGGVCGRIPGPVEK